MGPAVRRAAALDLDTDPSLDAVFGTLLGPLSPTRQGCVPGSTDAFETLVRAIVGQQISAAGAYRRRPDRRGGRDRFPPSPHLVHPRFPTAAVATIDPAALVMPQRRRRRSPTLPNAPPQATSISAPDATVPQHAPRRSTSLTGPWTADYVLLRGSAILTCSCPPTSVLRTVPRDDDHRQLRHAAGPLALWRSYALHH